MTDYLESLKTYSAWVGGEDETLHVSVGLFQAIDAAIEEIERLRVNEKASIATVRKWAAERVDMFDEIERLRKITADHAGTAE